MSRPNFYGLLAGILAVALGGYCLLLTGFLDDYKWDEILSVCVHICLLVVIILGFLGLLPDQVKARRDAERRVESRRKLKYKPKTKKHRGIDRVLNYQKHAADLQNDTGNNDLFDPMVSWRHDPIYDWHPLNFWYNSGESDL